ncbi:hypothetical protein ACJX0J_035909, partial [Zea mays]
FFSWISELKCGGQVTFMHTILHMVVELSIVGREALEKEQRAGFVMFACMASCVLQSYRPGCALLMLAIFSTFQKIWKKICYVISIEVVKLWHAYGLDTASNKIAGIQSI